MSVIGSSAFQKLSALKTFLNQHPQITYTKPSSPKYDSLREVWCLHCKGKPLIIVRPQIAEDVGLLVKYAKSQVVKFVIRTGGHSLFGQSTPDGAMTIDMRDITYAKIDEGRKSAKVGGDLTTPTKMVPSVGYVGWTAYGGHGPLSEQYGIGADQILAARIVDPNGTIVEADDTLLRGIRGAGGIFGVIVEVTVKVYPLKKILTGTLIFASHGTEADFKELNRRYRELSDQGLPSELYDKSDPYSLCFRSRNPSKHPRELYLKGRRVATSAAHF